VIGHVRALFIALVMIGACWRSSPPPPTQPAADKPTLPGRTATAAQESAMHVLERFAEDMCDCHDSQCAQGVLDEMTRWSQEQKNSEQPPKLSDDDVKRAAALGERLGMCMQKAISAGPPAGSAMSAGPSAGSGTP
jgi:hypothetical protein